MSLNISQYVDPGVFIGEVVVPGSVTVATVPNTTTLIGIANRNKRTTNEAETRGLVSAEALTLAGSSPHTVTLASISNRQSAQTNVFKDGVALDSSLVTFLPATVTGGTLTTVNFTTTNEISLALDGKGPVTIKIVGGVGDSTTILNGLITQQLNDLSGGVTAVTPAQIVEGINKALNGASSLGYGPAYGGVASTASSKVTLTSPTAGPLSDVRLYQAYPATADVTATVFGVSLPFQAPTVIQVADSAYSATSVYTANYVSTNSNIDELQNANVQSIVKVGAFAGVTSFKLGVDYNVDGDNDGLDWSIATSATFTSSVAAASFDVSTNNTVLLALDGRGAVSIQLNALVSPPPGYANPSSPAAATPAELANNINAVLANAVAYGPPYHAVCTVSGSGSNSKLVLTSPNKGLGSMVQLGAPATLSATTALFGLSAGQLPFAVFGVGTSPVPGAIYFVTYEYTRPSTDYNVIKRFFTPDSLYQDLGFPKAGNSIAVAAGVAFDNLAPSVLAVQVNDQTFPGNPQQPEFLAALNVTNSSNATTEICVLSTALQTQIDTMNNVINESSPTEKNYRRGWFGMPRNTVIGDRDTPGSFVAMAVRTLQVPGDSPGRGRLILCAPSNVSRQVTLEDGSVTSLDLDGSYLAVAVASRMTAFTSPSDTLLRKTLSGFRSDNFQTYLKQERALLASNGVTVATMDPSAGTITLLDPITTEAGGGKLASFQEISASTQKDAVTTAITQSVDTNLVGVVPSDLATFIVTVKGYIGGVLRSLIASGAIGPYKTPDGITRDIDFSKDMQVFQDKNDPTLFRFRYFFNLRYPAKRFFGEYSVDNPFFSA